MSPKSRLEALNDRRLLYVVEGALSVDECRAQVSRIEASKRHVTTDRRGHELVRRTERVILTEPELARALYSKIVAHVPAALVGMEPIAANDCIRCYRYQVGDFFKPHQDTHFVRSASERSLLSIVVYLNDDFEGGEVVFPDGARVLRPTPGTAVVFGHRLVHESRPILRGIKYALRSDVIYRLREASPDPDRTSGR
jgi:prolyl 4-hydroxylase